MEVKSVIQPKKPKAKHWVKLDGDTRQFTFGYESFAYCHPTGIFVISSVEVANDENDIDKGPEYHISITKNGGRCTSNEAAWACKQFDMLDSDEDNHVPYGIARNFWKPVSEKFIGHVCPCKKTETAIKENKGDYIWRGID